MDRKEEKSGKRDWWTKTARLHMPAETNEILRTMKQRRERLFGEFLEHKEGKELVEVLRKLLEDIYALAHYWGIRRGFTVAQQLEKLAKKKNEAYKAEILRIIVQHPEWTVLEIYTEMDLRNVKLVRLGNAPRDAEYWFDVVKEPSYKMLVTRLRQYADRLTRVHAWKRIMKAHDQTRRGATEEAAK